MSDQCFFSNTGMITILAVVQASFLRAGRIESNALLVVDSSQSHNQ